MITGVKIEYTKASAVYSKGGFKASWDRAGGAVAYALAKAIKRRVMKTGDLAGQRFPGYPSTNKRIVGPRYPVSGGEVLPNGIRRFDSSAELHQSTKRGSYNVTGGMWSGLTMVVGPYGGILKFRGRSIGQKAWAQKRRRLKSTGQLSTVGRRVNTAKVNNALKAASVFDQHHVHLLMLSNMELEAVAQGLAIGMSRQITSVGPVAVEWERATMTERVQREIVRRLG